MVPRSLIITICLSVWLVSNVKSQDPVSSDSSSLTRFVDESGPGNIWILVPSNVNFSDAYINGPQNYNLLKLDTSLLTGLDSTSSEGPQGSSDGVHSDGNRESRKMNLFRKPWFKPKSSPLFLVNGTVCRYVNQVPVCTFLTTSGLMRKLLAQS